jgi:hypothetical protein
LADTFRAHDPLILHWLVSSGFTSLLTDFGPAAPGTALAQATMLAPMGRVEFEKAKVHWTAFWNGQMDLVELFRHHGNHVAMVAPDPCEFKPRFLALLQRYLLEKHLEDVMTETNQEWSFGILSYMTKIPSNEQGDQVQLALHMNPMELMHVGLWGFMDAVHVLKPRKVVQFQVGFVHPKPHQVPKFHTLLIFSSSNQSAKSMVREAPINGFVILGIVFCKYICSIWHACKSRFRDLNCIR